MARAAGTGSTPLRADEARADYFDGRQARPQRVRLRVAGDELRIDGEPDGKGDGEGVSRRVPVDAVRWPERRRRGARVAVLPDGSTLHGVDAEPWDDWLRGAGVGESPVVRAQQSWRAAGLAVIALSLLLVAGWIWGIPLASRGVLAFVPAEVDRALGDRVAASLVGPWLAPSALPESERERIAAAFEDAVAKAWREPAASAGGAAAAGPPRYELRFHRGRLGPNALALPGGIIVLTDEMVELAAKAGPDATAMLVGVLAHELGHVQRRHGMRGLVQATLVGSAAAVALGDFSTLFAAAPAWLAQQGYSRDFEREADADSVRILKAAGYSPAVMARFFELIRETRRDPPVAGAMQRIAIALSSHPADEARIRFFMEAENPGAR